VILFGLAVDFGVPAARARRGTGGERRHEPLDFPVRIDGASLQWQVSPKFAIEPQFWASHVGALRCEPSRLRVRGELRLRGYPLSKDPCT
jgi:hypothetical protein